MTKKMQPFWWFLPPPYVYPCWYNECENCTDWTVQSPLECSVDTVNKKQGTGSIKIHSPPRASTSERRATIAAAQCNPWFGFWIRNQNTWDMGLKLLKADGSYVEIIFLDGQYSIYIYDPVKGGYNIAWKPYTSLTWLWVEFKVSETPLEVECYINGVHEVTFEGWNIYPVATAAVFCTWLEEDYTWVDWLRWFPTQEYPPTYPY